MNGAVILAFYFFGLACLTPAISRTTEPPPASTRSKSSAQQSQGAETRPQAQPAQGSEPAQPASTPTGQKPNSAVTAKPSSNGHGHHKKAIPPNCSNAPAPMNTKVGGNADGANSTAGSGAGSTGAASSNGGSTATESTNAGSTNGDSPNADSKNSSSTPLPPCPPPKKVVRNGGSDEPSIQLVEGTPAEQAAQQRSTDQLRLATEENLKKIAMRQLSPAQQEMVSQIKQFMDQSKTALAAGDLERGHNLAMKARLLSDELLKP